MDPTSVISQYGWPIGSMCIIVMAFYLDLIVTGTRHRALEADYKERLKECEQTSADWRQLALGQMGVTHSALNIAERHVPRGGTAP